MNYLIINTTNFSQELRTMKFPNDDNECFRWHLVRYLNTVNKNLVKIRNDDKQFEKQLNFKGVKIPLHKKGLREN